MSVLGENAIDLIWQIYTLFATLYQKIQGDNILTELMTQSAVTLKPRHK